MGEQYILFVFETHGEKQNGKVAGEMGKVYHSECNVANLLLSWLQILADLFFLFLKWFENRDTCSYKLCLVGFILNLKFIDMLMFVFGCVLCGPSDGPQLAASYKPISFVHRK